jgi:hypothetical protein
VHECGKRNPDPYLIILPYLNATLSTKGLLEWAAESWLYDFSSKLFETCT